MTLRRGGQAGNAEEAIAARGLPATKDRLERRGDVLAGDRLGAVGVAAAKRLEQPDVLLPRLSFLGLGVEMRDAPVEVVETAAHGEFGEERVPGRVDDRPVELLVHGDHLVPVARVGDAKEDARDLIELLVGRVQGGEARGVALERGAASVDLLDLAGIVLAGPPSRGGG